MWNKIKGWFVAAIMWISAQDVFEKHWDVHPLEPREPEPPKADLCLDVSLETARALHRVWRALNDGDCPKCHKHVAATAVDRSFNGLTCPNCSFFIHNEEIEEIEALFAPAMDACVKVFEDWRAQNDEPDWRQEKCNCQGGGR